MARIRTIKPQFWLNEELGTIPRDARLLYIGLWNLADDRGVFEWKPGQIKIQIFPYDTDISTKNIEKWLENLQKILNITKFKEDGKDYGYIIMFSKHQEIKRPSKWTFTKNLPQITPNTHPLVGEDSPTAPDNCGTAPESSPTAPLREKEKEKEKETRGKKPDLEQIKLDFAKRGLPMSEAERFWNYYESNGWRVGKNPMRSWVGAAANWKKNYDERRFQNPKTQTAQQNGNF